MWKITPVLLTAAGRRRAAATTPSRSSPLPGVTPYRFFCAVQRADPILQKKSPPGRVAVLINRFKRLSPQAKGGLRRMLKTIKGVPPRKRADKYKELVLSRRRYEGFSSSSAAASSSAKKSAVKSASTARAKQNKSATKKGSQSTAAPAASSTISKKARRVERLKHAKSKARLLLMKKGAAMKQQTGNKNSVNAGGKNSKNKKGDIIRQKHAQNPPSAGAPFSEHMVFLLHRIRSNKIGPREAAKLINELRRRFQKC